MTTLATCMLLAMFQQKSEYGACADYKLPVHGTILGNTLYGFFNSANSGKRAIYEVRLNTTPEKYECIWFSTGQCDAHCRHHLSKGKLWFFLGPESVSWRRLDRPPRFDDLDSFSADTLRTRYERERGSNFSGLSGYDPAWGVAIDFLPVGDKEVRLFYFVMKTKRIETWETQWELKKFKNRSGREIADWKAIADERNPETIESAFAEDFYVFQRKSDYYFVTASGKVYHSPPPKEGDKVRTMKARWTDAKRPIVAVLEDADLEKIWLFAKDNNPGAKRDLFFEIQDTLPPGSFDPATLRPVDIKGRAKTLLEYLQVIRK